MQIAVLSGKGGTGKTFVSVNLAYAGGKSVYIDCDVEEPNGRLFLKPKVKFLEKVNVMVPYVDVQRCTGCRKCADFCRFNALAYIKDKLLVFPELCHACAGCVMLCPENSLREAERYIGHIEHGVSGEIEVMTGVLNTGEATGVPIIRKLLSMIPDDRTVIVDCPPGSACTVMESIRDADFCLLVAEPTIFGIHNLDMVYKLVNHFKKPCALVVNKEIGDRSLIEGYCTDNNILVISSIPYDSKLATANSKGLVAAKEYTGYLNIFSGILKTIEKEVLSHETAGHIKR